jgi:hypothetical protein
VSLLRSCGGDTGNPEDDGQNQDKDAEKHADDKVIHGWSPFWALGWWVELEKDNVLFWHGIDALSRLRDQIFLIR